MALRNVDAPGEETVVFIDDVFYDTLISTFFLRLEILQHRELVCFLAAMAESCQTNIYLFAPPSLG